MKYHAIEFDYDGPVDLGIVKKNGDDYHACIGSDYVSPEQCYIYRSTLLFPVAGYFPKELN